MDELFKTVLLQVPLAAVVGVALYKVYTDGRADRKYMMELLERAYMRIKQLGGDEPNLTDETLMKRPN